MRDWQFFCFAPVRCNLPAGICQNMPTFDKKCSVSQVIHHTTIRFFGCLCTSIVLRKFLFCWADCSTRRIQAPYCELRVSEPGTTLPSQPPRCYVRSFSNRRHWSPVVRSWAHFGSHASITSGSMTLSRVEGLRSAFAARGHNPSPAVWVGLEDLLACLERMAQGCRPGSRQAAGR